PAPAALYTLSLHDALPILLGWVLTISAMMSDLSLLAGAFDPVLILLQIASVIVFPGSLAVGLWHAGNVWSGGRRWPAKIWSIVLDRKSTRLNSSHVKISYA